MLHYTLSLDADTAMDVRIALRQAAAFLRREAATCAKEGWSDLAEEYITQADAADRAYKAYKTAITRAETTYKVETDA